MVKLHINKDVGYTVENLPEQVFGLIKEIDNGADGSLQLRISPEDEQRAVRLLSNGGRPVQTPVHVSRVGDVTRLSLAENETEEQDTAQENRPTNEARGTVGAVEAPGDVRDVRDEARDAGAEMDTEDVERAARPTVDDNPEGLPVNRGNDEAVDVADDVPPPRPLGEAVRDSMPIELADGMVSPQTLQADIKIEKESVYAAIARLLEDDSVGQAKRLTEVKREYDNMFRQMLIKKRDIQLLEHDIKDHPIIKNILEQVVALKSHKHIDEVYFTESQLVVITGELITEEVAGEKRRVGKMRLGVDLNAFFAPKALTDINVISIQNLTHRYKAGNRLWECGHVNSEGGKCVGGTFDFLFEAFVNRDLEYIFESLIRFITLPDEHDVWGNHMKNWAIAEESITV